MQELNYEVVYNIQSFWLLALLFFLALSRRVKNPLPRTADAAGPADAAGLFALERKERFFDDVIRIRMDTKKEGEERKEQSVNYIG